MGRLLERLLSESRHLPAAIPAIPANPPPKVSDGIAESQESQGTAVAKVGELRAHLLTLAADERLPAGLVHGLDDADVTACIGESDATLRAYLLGLARRARMDAGMVPFDWKATAHCAGCGPVYWHKAERLTACPWCFKRNAGKSIPRPQVKCGDCRHYSPDPLNPAAGVGRCGLGVGRGRWPMQVHPCGDWSST